MSLTAAVPGFDVSTTSLPAAKTRSGLASGSLALSVRVPGNDGLVLAKLLAWSAILTETALAVEFLQSLQSFLLQLSLARTDQLQQRTCNWISRAVQAVYPLLHHVNVAQFAEPAKQPLSCLLHCLPRGIGIKDGNPSGQRATAAKRDPQVVNRVGRKRGACPVAFLEHALHPESQADFVLNRLFYFV